MLITGSPAAWYSCRNRAMFSNCALRSGWCPIVFFFRAVRRPNFSFRSKRRMVRRLAGVPIATNRRNNSRSDKFVHNTPARMGSPAVNSPSSCRKLASRDGQMVVRARRPPLFFGSDPLPDLRVGPTPSSPAGWFLDRRLKAARCTRRPHVPAWPPQPRHIADGPSPTANRRTVSSSFRQRPDRHPCQPPDKIHLTMAKKPTQFHKIREVVLGQILSDLLGIVGFVWLLGLAASIFWIWMLVDALMYEPTTGEKL